MRFGMLLYQVGCSRCYLLALIVAVVSWLALGIAAYAKNPDAAAVIRWPAEKSVAIPASQIVDGFVASLKADANINTGREDKASIGWFASKDEPFDVLVWNHLPNAIQKDQLARGFPSDAPQSAMLTVGWRQVVVIVNENNTLRQISLADIGKILPADGKNLGWQTIGGSGGTIRCYGEAKDSWSRDLLRRQCMFFTEDMGHYVRGRFLPFRDDFKECDDAADVIKKVRADRNGIGFLQYTDQPIKGVKILAVNKNDKDAQDVYVSPKLGEFQDDYSFCEPLVLYLHPKAPMSARAFCEFAAGPDGSVILEKMGFITSHTQNLAQAQTRLAEMKAGKGPKIMVSGAADKRAVFQEVAVDFVRAKALLQVTYQPGESAAAVGGFVSASSPQRELLLLDGPPNEQTMRQHSVKWNDLQPTESTPAASAVVAVVVNPANKIASLSLDQLQSILNGKTSDWKLLGSGSGDIRVFGLPGDTATSKLISKELLPFAQATKLKPRKDVAEVLSAVSLDPLAIGFVDLAAIPAGQNVRILPIGPAAKPADPTPANIKSGMYPLAQRMFLYVHPKASDVAKDFAKFLTSGECDETFRKHGLIPLSDKAVAGLDKLSTSPAMPIDKPAPSK